jgi:hypothetical protein
MPTESDLPPSLRESCSRQAVEISPQRLDYDTDQLIKRLRQLVPPVAPPSRPPAPSPRPSPRPSPDPVPWFRSYPAVLAISLVFVLGGVGLYFLLSGPGPNHRTTTSTTLPNSPDTTAAKSSILVSNGPWSTQGDGLTVTVIRVDNAGGVITLHLRVTNSTTSQVSLPLFQNFTAVDNAGNTYGPNVGVGGWTINIPGGVTIDGSIVLEQRIDSAATSLGASFSEAFGSSGTGTLTVSGIVLPH